jgi:cation diffusion facilitator family transporter
MHGIDAMEESRIAVAAALVGNLALALLKAISAFVTGSAAMLAETFHSAADTGNQVLLLLGMRLGRQPPDAVHPFGYGKNVYFWAFVVSVMLFTVGGAFSIWEGLHKLRAPGQHGSLAWAFGVLAGAFVFESISLAVAVRSLRRAKGRTPLREFWRESRDPTLITVVLEDSSALLSIVLAAGGLGLSSVTGQPAWDSLASVAIGLVLIGVAIVLAFENYSLLLGEAAPPDVLARISRAAAADPAVTGVMGLRTMHLGPTSLLVVLQVDFRDELSAAEVEAAAERLRDAVAAEVGDSGKRRLIVIEPVTVPARAPAAA